MSHLLRGWLVAALLSGMARPLSAQQRRIAITVDDLPSVMIRDSIEVEYVTTTFLKAFTRHHVEATGFVNSSKLGQIPSQMQFRSDMLRRWLAAGQSLGNHGAYHLSANEVPLAAFLADARAGDSLPRALSAEAGRPYGWYRLPYLHSGTSDSTRASIDSTFGSMGLRIAPVTIDSRDWIFAGAWRAALARQDSATMRRVSATFLDFADEILAYHERLAQQIMGRPIAHVMLLHANPMTADALEPMLRRLERRTYRFVPLDTAFTDPVYARPDRYRGAVGLLWLERQAIYLQGVRIDNVPVPPAWIDSLANAAPPVPVAGP